MLAKIDMQSLLLLAGVVVLAIVMMRASRQRLARAQRGRSDDGPPSDRLAAARQAQGVRDQLDELMVQLEELARVTSAQIDTRSTKLDVLLAEADEKIRRLEALLTSAEGRAARGGPAAAAASAPRDAVQPDHRKVYDLADAGRTSIEIAQELSRDTGEVELILALRKKT